LEGASRDAANCGIQSGNIAAAGEYSDDAFFSIDVGQSLFASPWIRAANNYPRVTLNSEANLNPP
jgi:hypothetical protein